MKVWHSVPLESNKKLEANTYRKQQAIGFSILGETLLQAPQGANKYP